MVVPILSRKILSHQLLPSRWVQNSEGLSSCVELWIDNDSEIQLASWVELAHRVLSSIALQSSHHNSVLLSKNLLNLELEY